MMEPPPALRISGMAYLAPRKTPVELISMIRSHRSPSVSSTVLGAAPEPIPALFTSTSSLPYLDTVAAMAPFQESSLVTSSLTNRTSPPAARILASAARPCSSRTSPRATLAPSAAKSSASQAPIPLAAPLMNATLPSSLGRRPSMPLLEWNLCRSLGYSSS